MITPAIAAGPFAIATTLLVLGGMLKAVRPGDTARALKLVGVPLAVPATVRVGGAIEAGIGAWALMTADRWSAIVVAASYVVFAAFVGLALVRGLAISSCGCFGKADTPPSLAHVVVNAGAVLAAAATALDPGAGLLEILADQPIGGVGFVILVATGVLLALAALTDLPKVLAQPEPDRRGFGA